MLYTTFIGIEAQFVFFPHFNLSAISFIKEITVSYKFPRITFCFVLCFSSHSRISLHGDVTLISKGLQIFIYTRHSACHTLFDTWHPFIWSSPRTLDARTCAVELSLPFLMTWVCRCWDSNNHLLHATKPPTRLHNNDTILLCCIYLY